MACYNCNNQIGYIPSITESYMSLPFYSKMKNYERNSSVSYVKEIGMPGNYQN